MGKNALGPLGKHLKNELFQGFPQQTFTYPKLTMETT